jgi:hypothetical protein
MYQLYERVAPRPQDFGRLLGKLGEMMATPFDYTEDLRGIAVPTLLAAGDADQAPPAHYAEMFGLLGGGHDGGWMGENRPAGGHALAILPGLQHYNIFASPLLAATVLSFLDAPRTLTRIRHATARQVSSSLRNPNHRGTRLLLHTREREGGQRDVPDLRMHGCPPRDGREQHHLRGSQARR